MNVNEIEVMQRWARVWTIALLFALALAASPLVAQAPAYIRSLEGRGSLIDAEGNEVEAQINLPIVAGDRLDLDHGSRAEVVLSDGSRVFVDQGSRLALVELPREGSTGTTLELLFGRLAVDRSSGDAEAELVIRSLEHRLALDPQGRYLVETDEGGEGRAVVRLGSASLSDSSSSMRLTGGQAARFSADDSSLVALGRAPETSDLERWSGFEDRLASRSPAPPTRSERGRGEPYDTEPLDRHGEWVDSSSGHAWRPYAGRGWRPYQRGWWRSTPYGLTWVSSEPWGWTTSHYGTWSLDPYHGWVWYPGEVYSPAWVYWYWGPSYAAWVPVGYYTYHYSARPYLSFGFDFRHGLYGWVDTGWGSFVSWTFCPVDSIRGPRGYGYYRSGSDLARRGGRPERGLVTTDTRPLARARWTRPDEAQRLLLERSDVTERDGSGLDVSSFVERRGDFDAPTARRVLTRDERSGVHRQATRSRRGVEARATDRSRLEARAVPDRGTMPRGRDRAAVGRLPSSGTGPGERDGMTNERDGQDAALRRAAPRTGAGATTRIDRGSGLEYRAPDRDVPVARRVVDGIRGSRSDRVERRAPERSQPDRVGAADDRRRVAPSRDEERQSSRLRDTDGSRSAQGSRDSRSSSVGRRDGDRGSRATLRDSGNARSSRSTRGSARRRDDGG